MQFKKVCLITTGHISSNPRLLKEASSLSNAGYEIHIVFTQYLEYLVAEDFKILYTHPDWKYSNFLWTPIKKTLRLKTALVQKITKWIYPVIRLNELIINRNYNWQLRRAIEIKADLYIAHNLGALPVAVNAAKANKTKCGFDAEDFHRNEISDDVNSFDVRLKKQIEDKYLEELDYLTAASPLIANAYRGLYPQLNPVVINNVFEIRNQPKINTNKNNGLKLFWFSQTIGRSRGLEDIISALNQIENPLIELHLLGKLSVEDAKYFNKLANFEIRYHKPISPTQIFNLASDFDLGLALELNIPLNRNICLTNKIFTYLVSGLAILASNTKAQERFLQENNNIGELYQTGNVSMLADIITKLFNDRELLNEYKRNALELAESKYNWELEKEKIIKIINKVIN